MAIQMAMKSLLTSQPAWAAGIEIVYLSCGHEISGMSQPAWAAGIEILRGVEGVYRSASRSPHGLRGLKFNSISEQDREMLSQPAWAAGIEIMQKLQ